MSCLVTLWNSLKSALFDIHTFNRLLYCRKSVWWSLLCHIVWFTCICLFILVSGWWWHDWRVQDKLFCFHGDKVQTCSSAILLYASGVVCPVWQDEDWAVAINTGLRSRGLWKVRSYAGVTQMWTSRLSRCLKPLRGISLNIIQIH